MPQEMMDGLTMFPGLERQAIDQVAVLKQGTTKDWQVTAQEGQVANSAGSSGSARSSSVGDNGLRDSGSNIGGQPPAPLTRDNIPALVREITRKLRSDNTEVHLPLVPGT